MQFGYNSQATQDQTLTRDVEVVLKRALRMTQKMSENELTLVEILDSYDSIICEDDMKVSAPQLNVENRSRVYLQLLKFKKNQEDQQLRKINEEIENFQSLRSQKSVGGLMDPDSQFYVDQAQLIPERQVSAKQHQYVTFSHEEEAAAGHTLEQNKLTHIQSSQNILSGKDNKGYDIFSAEATLEADVVYQRDVQQSPTANKKSAKHKFKAEKKLATKKSSLNRSVGGAMVSDNFKRQSGKQFSTLSSQKLLTNRQVQNHASKERSNSSAGAGSQKRVLPRIEFKGSRKSNGSRNSTSKAKSKSKSKERGDGTHQRRESAAVSQGHKPFVSLRGGAAVLAGARGGGARKGHKAHSSMSNAKELRAGAQRQTKNQSIQLKKENKQSMNQWMDKRTKAPEGQATGELVNINLKSNHFAESGSRSRSHQSTRSRKSQSPGMLLLSNLHTGSRESLSRSKSPHRASESKQAQQVPGSRSREYTSYTYTNNDVEDVQALRQKSPNTDILLSKQHSPDRHEDETSTEELRSAMLDRQFSKLSDYQIKEEPSELGTSEFNMSKVKREEEREGAYPRQDRLEDLRRKIDHTQANLDWLQGNNSCNLPRSKEDLHANTTEPINNESFKIPDRLPKLSVTELLAQAKSQNTQQSNLSASNNLQSGYTNNHHLDRSEETQTTHTQQTEQLIKSEAHIYDQKPREAEKTRPKMVIESPSVTSTSFDLTPAYGRDTKENQRASKCTPLRESRWSNQQQYFDKVPQNDDQKNSKPEYSLTPGTDISPTRLESSFMLAYALHYEVGLMRKIMMTLKHLRLLRQKERLNARLAKETAIRNLKYKTFRTLRQYYHKHCGHQESNRQAQILSNYIIRRKYLQLWLWRLHKDLSDRTKVQHMRARIKERLKAAIFEEWQSLSLAHQLYLAQKQTSHMFYNSQVTKKAYLSLKFFTRFSQKQKFSHELQLSHQKVRLCRKVLLSLQENIQLRDHKKDKYLLVFQVHEFNIQKRIFLMFKYICQSRKIERNSRQKSKEYWSFNILRKYWGAWYVFKLQESRNRLNENLADHYRVQRLQRQLLTDLKMSNEIFMKVYSDDKMMNIYNEKLYIKTLTSLLLYQRGQAEKMKMMPDQTAFYQISALWLQEHCLSTLPGAKYKKLQNRFHSRVNQGYKIKAMYALRENYKIIKAFRINVELKKVEQVFWQLRRYSTEKAVNKYKYKMVNEKQGFKQMAAIFFAMRRYCSKRLQTKNAFQNLSKMRERQQRQKILHIWLAKHLKLTKIRADKEFATVAHNRRYFTAFFQRWLRQYNKSQKKKYLNSLAQNYIKTKRRDRYFTIWLQIAGTSMRDQIQDSFVFQNYTSKVKKQVLETLQFNIVKRKRERIISSIIQEKQTQLIIFKTLEKWRQRHLEKWEKRQLYAQIGADYEDRVKFKIISTLKMYIQYQKEIKIEEICQKQKANEMMNQNM